MDEKAHLEEEKIRQDRKSHPKVTRDQYRFYLIQSSVVVIAAIVVISFYFCVKRYAGLAAGLKIVFTALSPILIGFALAFLLNPIMKGMEKRMLPPFLARTKNEEKTRHRVRMTCSLLALAIFIAIVAFFLSAVIPQLVSTINDLVNNINTQIVGVLDWVDKITGGRFHDVLESAKIDKNITNTLNKAVLYVRDYLNLGSSKEIVNTVTDWGISIGKGLFNLILGFIVSVYVLVDKETFKSHTKKLIYGIFKTSHANVVLDIGRKTKEVFYGFIVGKIIDSLIIGIICYICMLIFRFPYPVLCSFIIGVTNIIPVFGPYIGAVPTVILVFMNNPVQGIYMLIFVIVLQQVDGNIIGPAILGNSTGLSSFWVVFAITIGGGLFGIPGMIIGVPIVAVLYYIGSMFANWCIDKRGFPREREEYTQLKFVDPETKAFIQKTPEEIENSIMKKSLLREWAAKLVSYIRSRKKSGGKGAGE